jgi:uncharacterized membrane protein YbaN (DUF454 family)
VIGIFVPLWPTTPFILLAAICYSRSSERFHDWIYQHRIFGPMLRAWEQHGVISPRAKLISALGLVGSMAIMVTRVGFPWGAAGAVVAAGAMVFVISRPSRIPGDATDAGTKTNRP